MKGQFQRSIEAGGEERTDSGILDFPDLCKHDGNSFISATMGYSLNFAKGKASVTVTLKCDQVRDTLDRAADMALSKADELAAEGLKMAEARVEQLRAAGMDI
jgi:hypothetical protein